MCAQSRSGMDALSKNGHAADEEHELKYAVDRQMQEPRDRAGADDAHANSGWLQEAFKILTYGAVNSMMTIPCMYGYAAIIFR